MVDGFQPPHKRTLGNIGMSNFNELIKSIEHEHPNDWWVNRRKESLKFFPELEKEFAPYESSLKILDNESLTILSEKSKLAFSSDHRYRGKHQFFDTLNEALAYEYLVDTGFENVRFLREDKKHKTPDISFFYKDTNHFCEVKTIGISDKEIELQQSDKAFNCSIYIKLNDSFFEKLHKTIANANHQILSRSSSGIIYIIIDFDDFTLTHYATYQEQLREYLIQAFPSLIITLRIGRKKHYQLSHNNLIA